MDAVTTPGALTFIKRLDAYFETLASLAETAGDYAQAQSARGNPRPMDNTHDRERRRTQAWNHVRRFV